MYELISGALMMVCLVAGTFFFKFWRKTHDKLFLMFAASFWLLSFERLVLGHLGTSDEINPRVYLIRLTAFSLILIAIIMKNRERSQEK